MRSPPTRGRRPALTLAAASADAEAAAAVDRLLVRLVAVAEALGAEAILDELLRYARPEDGGCDG